MERYYIGIDFGGTFIKGGLVNESGEILVLDSIPTEAEKGAEDILGRIAKFIRVLAGEKGISGIGLGIPGLIDEDAGEVVMSGNLNWTHVKVVNYLRREFVCPVRITNDANAAALGESKFGSGRAFNSSVFITIGTGIGSGIVIDGKLFTGNRGAGAELGHMIIHPNGEPCTCGSFGCYETYASATALKRETQKAAKANPKCLMAKEVPYDELSAKTVFIYADRDPVAKKVLDEFLENMAIGVVNVANIFRPEAIIFGGGMAKEGDGLLIPLRAYLKKYIFAKNLGPQVELLCSTLKNAGVCGAAALNM